MSDRDPATDLRPGIAPDPRLAELIPHPAPFFLGIDVHREHIHDAIDHVPNVQYVTWIDRAAELHADAVGFTRKQLLEAGVMWFVARHEVDYRAEVGVGERLVIATWIDSMARVKAWRGTRIARSTDGCVVLNVRTLWVLVDLATRRPVRAWPDMVRAFAPASREGSRACTSH